MASLTLADGSSLGVLKPVAVEAVELPAGFNSAGDGIEVAVVDGELNGVAMLAVPGSAPPTAATPVLLHQNELGRWEPDLAVFQDGMYRAQVSSFSIRVPGWFRPGEWYDSATNTVRSAVGAAGDAADTVTDWVTGRTDPPEDCSGADPYPWVSMIGPPGDGAFHICTNANPADDGTERVEVKIKSNRAVAMWVVIPTFAYDYLWVESSTWGKVNPFLRVADEYYFGDAPDHRVLLPPGRTMTIGYRQPEDTGIELVFSSYQNTTTQLASLMTRLIGELGALGTVSAMVNCYGSLSAASPTPWSVITGCARGAADITEAQLKVTLSTIISDGRMALSTDDRTGLEQALVESEQVGSSLTALKKAVAIVRVAEWLKDGTLMLNDALVGTVPDVNTTSVWLTGTDNSPSTPPTTFDVPNPAQLDRNARSRGHHPIHLRSPRRGARRRGAST